MWNLDKIKRYISDGVEENIHLDYKGAGSIAKQNEKKKELSKDVSAFANSDGGVIIYGVREYDDKEKNHLPEKIDPIDGTQYTKEWLEQVINSNISPRIVDVKITPIQTSKPEDNQIVFVVEIPKSNTAHQASDKRYYRRFNFESKMMDDWEIKDIINRQVKTNVVISFEPRVDKKTLSTMLKGTSNYSIELDIWAKNIGNRVAQFLDCYVSGNTESAKHILEPFVDRKGFQERFTNETERKVKIEDEEYTISVERVPILPNTSRRIGYLKIKADFFRTEHNLNLQVATEDSSKSHIVTGIEMIEKTTTQQCV